MYIMSNLKKSEREYLRYLISKREAEEKQWLNSLLEDMVKSQWLDRTIERRIDEFNNLKNEDGSWFESVFNEEESRIDAEIENAVNLYQAQEEEFEELIKDNPYESQEEEFEELIKDNPYESQEFDEDKEIELYEKQSELEAELERIRYDKGNMYEKEPFDDLDGIDYPDIPTYGLNEEYDYQREPDYFEPPEFDYEPVFDMGDFESSEDELRDGFEEYLIQQALEESIENQYTDMFDEVESKDSYLEHLIENHEEEGYIDSIIEKRLSEEQFLDNIIKEAIAENNYFQEAIDRHLCESESLDYNEDYFDYENDFDDFIYYNYYEESEEEKEPFDDLDGIDYPDIPTYGLNEEYEYQREPDYLEPPEFNHESPLEKNDFESHEKNLIEDYDELYHEENSIEYPDENEAKSDLDYAIEEKLNNDYWLEKTLVNLIKEDDMLNEIIKERIAKDKEFNEKINRYLND